MLLNDDEITIPAYKQKAKTVVEQIIAEDKAIKSTNKIVPNKYGDSKEIETKLPEFNPDGYLMQ